MFIVCTFYQLITEIAILDFNTFESSLSQNNCDSLYHSHRLDIWGLKVPASLFLVGNWPTIHVSVIIYVKTSVVSACQIYPILSAISRPCTQLMLTCSTSIFQLNLKNKLQRS